jgi:hypothetical protein
MKDNKTELPKEDLNLIAQIDARLRHYNLIQPIDTTEGEFNYCVDLDNGRDKCQEQCDYCVQRQVVLSQKQAPIETEQRWQPSYGVKYWYIGSNDGQFFVADFHWGNDDVDFVNHDTGNCFKSREAAQKAAEAIKKYLSSNKF